VKLTLEHPVDGLGAALRESGWSYSWSGPELEVDCSPARLRQLFSRLNGYPDFSQVEVERFGNAEQPRLSCIILLTHNDLFVRYTQIPSLIQNSSGHTVEILLVYNGSHVELDLFQNFAVHTGAYGSPSRGYNLGARQARGELLAFFHDDCLIDDPHWIDKALNQLDEDCLAVSPEFDREDDLVVAKCVPLVIRRRHFEELGGFDEHYYAGVEDVDFTHSILARRKRAERVDFGYMHIRGMSTCLAVAPEPRRLREWFGFNCLTPDQVQKLHRQSMESLTNLPQIAVVNSEYRLYFLDKYGAHLRENLEYDLERWAGRHWNVVRPHLLDPLARLSQDPQRLQEFWRGLRRY